MKTLHRFGLLLVVICLAASTSGCDRNKSSESAESQVDQAADTANQKYDQAKNEVKQEANNLGNSVDDAAVTGRVKAAILAEPGLKVLQIDVDTKGGVVTLSGTVDSPQSKEKAEQIASKAEGVKGVQNNLETGTKG